MYFLSTEIADTLATLVASEEALPVENLQDPLGTRRWRSTGLTPHVYGQFAASKTLTDWPLFYTNARSGDQVRLRLADSQANLTAAPDLDTGLVDVWPAGSDLSAWFGTGQPGYIHGRMPIAAVDQVAATWFRVDFDFTGNPDGYVEVGKLLLAERFKPASGHEWGWRYRATPRGHYGVEYAGGGIGRGGGSFKRDTAFRFPAMEEADMWGGFGAMIRERRSVKPVGVVLLEDESTYPMDYIYYGYLEVAEVPNPQWFVVECSITEP